MTEGLGPVRGAGAAQITQSGITEINDEFGQSLGLNFNQIEQVNTLQNEGYLAPDAVSKFIAVGAIEDLTESIETNWSQRSNDREQSQGRTR